MNAIRRLLNDHEEVQKLFNQYVDTSEQAYKQKKAIVDQIIDKITVHAELEEKILFPAIESRAFFPGCGLISEHQLGRERVQGMADAVERSLRGDAEGLRVFRRQARSLIAMLLAHIAKEDECLANVVHRAFSVEDGERLTQEFDEMERREVGAQTFERFAAIVEALEAKYSDGGRLT